MFDELHTLDDVRRFVTGSYAAVMASRESLRGLPPLDRLPLAVAEPGPLMEHAVHLAGTEGVTRQELIEVFSLLGKERCERGLAFLRAGGRVVEATEHRPNSAGRQQAQLVFRGSVTNL